MAVDDGQIDRAVVVEIGEHCAERGAVPRRRGQARGIAVIAELAVRALPPQPMSLIAEVGHEDVEQAVAINVGQGDTHVGLGLAHAVVGEAALHRFFLEGAVALVDP